MEQQHLVDTASAVFSSRTTNYGAYTTTGSGIVAALSKLDVVAQVFLCIGLVSLAFTALSFFMNWYYKHQKHKQERDLNNVKIKLMKEGKWYGQD